MEQMTPAGKREFRSTAIEISNREEAMLLAAHLVHLGFDFMYYDTDRGSIIRCRDKIGEQHALKLVRRK